MKMKIVFCAFLMSVLVVLSCGRTTSEASRGTSGEAVREAVRERSGLPAGEAAAAANLPADIPALMRTLDELAEIERAGSWFQGLALTESSIRENAGDFTGAVAAAFKELAWAYGMGLIQKSEIEKGLLNVLNITGEETVTAATNAIIAFLNGKWDAAAAGLDPFFNDSDEEPDSFGRWMILVCALEKNRAPSSEGTLSEGADRRTSAAYKSIRARYAQFPEYWYRGSRTFSGAIAAEFAENCINVSPQGPYAGECRAILASYAGLKNEEGLSIKTKREIEAIISQSVSSSNPQILNSLLPLISLPDNPYTVYAIGALRTLTSNPRFKDYFNAQAVSAKGRLSERLSYICRS